jgi:hypothetical protein
MSATGGNRQDGANATTRDATMPVLASSFANPRARVTARRGTRARRVQA